MAGLLLLFPLARSWVLCRHNEEQPRQQQLPLHPADMSAASRLGSVLSDGESRAATRSTPMGDGGRSLPAAQSDACPRAAPLQGAAMHPVHSTEPECVTSSVFCRSDTRPSVLSNNLEQAAGWAACIPAAGISV